MWVLLAGLVGAGLYRFRGMENPWWFPSFIRRAMFAWVPVAVIVGFNLDAFSTWPYWIVIGVTMFFTFLTTIMGHGGYMDFGHVDREEKEWIPEIFLPQDKGEFWHDATGMAISGASYAVSFIGLLFSVGAGWAGLFLVGVLKALAYIIGWFFYDLVKMNRPTEVAEILWGFFAYAGIFYLTFGL